MLRKPNKNVVSAVNNAVNEEERHNLIWKRFSEEFKILLDIGYYEGTKLAEFFNVINSKGKSNIYVPDPYEKNIKDFDTSKFSEIKFLVGLTGMGKTTLIRNYYRITDRDVKINDGEYLVYISLYNANVSEDRPYDSLCEEIENYMYKLVERLLVKYPKLTKNFWANLYDFIHENKPVILSTHRFTPSGVDLERMVYEEPTAADKNARLEDLYNRDPIDYYSSAIKYILHSLEKPYKLTFIFDDIEAKDSVFHKNIIEIARHIYACFNASADDNRIIKVLISIRAYTFRVNMERTAEARRELIQEHCILKRKTVSLHSIFNKRFKAIKENRMKNKEIGNQESYEEARKVLSYVEERLNSICAGLVFNLQNNNLCSSMVLYSSLLTNLTWIASNEKEVHGHFKLDEKNYKVTKFSVLKAIGMGNARFYDGNSASMPNIIQHKGFGTDLLCLYVIRYLRNRKLIGIYGTEYIIGKTLIQKIQGLFCSTHTSELIRKQWENKLRNTIDFLYSRGILFRSLYDIEFAENSEIKRTFHDDFKLYLSPRGEILYSLLGKNSILLEIYRDDIEIDLPDNDFLTVNMRKFDKFRYIIALLHHLFEVEKQNIAQALWDIDNYVEAIGNDFICQYILEGLINNICAYYGEHDENHRQIVEEMNILIDEMVRYGTETNKRHGDKLDLTRFEALRKKLNNPVNKKYLTPDDLYAIVKAEYDVQHAQEEYRLDWFDLLDGRDVDEHYARLTSVAKAELKEKIVNFIPKVADLFQELAAISEKDFDEEQDFIDARQRVVDIVTDKAAQEFSDFIVED